MLPAFTRRIKARLCSVCFSFWNVGKPSILTPEILYRGKDEEVGKSFISLCIYKDKPEEYSKAVQDSNFDVFEFIAKIKSMKTCSQRTSDALE